MENGAAACLPSPTQRAAHDWFSYYHSEEIEEEQYRAGSFDRKSRSDRLPSPFKKLEDAIFNLFKHDNDMVSAGKFLEALRSKGIIQNDPRLKEMCDQLQQLAQRHHVELNQLMLGRDEFTNCVNCNIVLVDKVLRNKLTIPDWPAFCARLQTIFAACAANTDGAVADYIPQLARQDPNPWAVAVCTVDGQRFSLGDSEKPVCMQALSRVLSYALALQDLGEDVVHSYVKQEPSGRNTKALLLDYENKPHNPMINTGALVVCSLLKNEQKLAERFDYVNQFYKRAAGGDDIGFNNAVFLSERDHGDRNAALAYFLREHHCFPLNTDIQETLDFIAQLCAVEITCEAGAVIAGTLANGGICPINDDDVMSANVVRDVLSMMRTCGMYDYSGQFAFKIGIPAKACVSGLILAVIPDVMGLCIWSPRLDSWGNSVRGGQFCEQLVQTFHLHNYDQRKRTDESLNPRKLRTQTRTQHVVNMLFAAASGDLSVLRRYYLQGLNFSEPDYDGRTALHLAAAEGHIDCVRFLLEKCRANTDARDRWNHTPMDDAVYNNRPKIIDLLRAANGTSRSLSTE